MAKKRMDDAAVLTVVQNEIDQSMSYSPNEGGATSIDIQTPLDYYLGKPDGTEQAGRSQVTSTDVADAIEWLMPTIMKEFTDNPDVVAFDPTCPGDEEQAELETLYTYDVIMKDNPGFVVLHTATKDALLQNNGVIKAYYKREDKEDLYRYTGLNMEQFQALMAEKNYEIQRVVDYLLPDGTALYDVTFVKSYKCHRICVESVPLENFKVNADHNSINLSNARFVSHTTIKTATELKQEFGLSQKEVDELNKTTFNNSSYRHEAQNETILVTHDTSDVSMNQYTVQESYLWMDYDQDGMAEYVKVTTVGDTARPTHVLSVEDLPDGSPWIGTTGILMSHKFRGMSIFDRIKEIQDQSTAVLRSTLDNFYLQNNQEKVVVEGMVNMDDMLTSMPGGIKRVKRLDSVQPLPTQPFTDAPIQLMRFLGEIKAGRTGVSADGTSAPQNLGDRVGSEGLDKLMSAKQELAGMIIRVLAETCLKELYVKVRDLAHRHIDVIQDYKFRDRWVQVNPTEWLPRTKTTVNVGLGATRRQEKLQAIMALQQVQTQLAQSPFAYMLSDVKVYNTINDACKFSGLNSAYKYILDPNSDEAKAAKAQMEQSNAAQKQKEDQMMAMQYKMQADLANAELMKAQAQQDNVQLKSQIESMKQERELEKQRYDTKLAMMTSQLDQLKMLAEGEYKDKELEFKNKELEQKTFVELVKVNAAAAKPEPKTNGETVQ